jgi:hypothetical protein
MPLVVALIVIGVLIGFLFYAFSHERPPAPSEVAIAYERAWDALDFSMLYDLSGAELRDGMKRDAFVAAKRAAHTGQERSRIGAHAEVETAVTGRDSALVVTNVSSAGSTVRNNVLLERRGGSWVVVEYRLRPDPADRH